MDRFYKVECDLDDIAEPTAPHAFGPVTITFLVRGHDLADAVENTKKALKETSKLRSTIEKIELKLRT